MAYIDYRNTDESVHHAFGAESFIHRANRYGAYVTPNPAAGAEVLNLGGSEPRIVVLAKDTYLPLLNERNLPRKDCAVCFWIVSPSQPPFPCEYSEGMPMSTKDALYQYWDEVQEAGFDTSLHAALIYNNQVVNAIAVCVPGKHVALMEALIDDMLATRVEPVAITR